MTSSPEYKGSVGSLPYFYLPGYGTFSKEQGKEMIYLTEGTKSMACQAWKNKFLDLLQPLYPPLDQQGQRLSLEEEKSFLESFISFSLKNRIAHRITQPLNFSIFHVCPDQSVSAPFGTYYLDLTKKEDELFGNLHGKHRNVIRNAEKNAVEIKFGEGVIRDFFTLYERTMKRSAMYCEPLHYFENLFRALPQNILCGVVYHRGIAEGGVFMPYTDFGAFYLYGASADKISVTGSMNYLHWKSMLLLKKKGVKRYDFAGARLSDVSNTKLEGIQQFKARFGSSLDKGFIWKKDLAPGYCGLFDNLVRFKLKLRGQTPPRDIIDQERARFDA